MGLGENVAVAVREVLRETVRDGASVVVRLQVCVGLGGDGVGVGVWEMVRTVECVGVPVPDMLREEREADGLAVWEAELECVEVGRRDVERERLGLGVWERVVSVWVGLRLWVREGEREGDQEGVRLHEGEGEGEQLPVPEELAEADAMQEKDWESVGEGEGVVEGEAVVEAL